MTKIKRIFSTNSYWLSAISFFFISSCNKAPVCDCFESAGPPSSDNRTPVLPYFEQIDAHDNINVFLTMGSREQVIIEGGKNLIKNISATVADNTLTLKNENNCDWLRSYKKSIINVYITMPVVNSIINEGVGTIQSTDTITTPNLKVQTLSAGDIVLAVHCNSILGFQTGAAALTLSGICSSFETNFYTGTGVVQCGSLNAGYVFLSSSTTGDCYVNTGGELDVLINQIGNVYYSGNPNTVHATINGSGRLIKN